MYTAIDYGGIFDTIFVDGDGIRLNAEDQNQFCVTSRVCYMRR